MMITIIMTKWLRCDCTGGCVEQNRLLQPVVHTKEVENITKKNLTKTNLTKHTHKQRDMFMQGAEGGLFTNVVNNFGVTAYGLYLLCHVLTQFADPTETQQQQYNACKGCHDMFAQVSSPLHSHTYVRTVHVPVCVCVCMGTHCPFFFYSSMRI